MIIGKKIWATPEGFIPEWSHGQKPELESHETLCFLNTSNENAKIELYVYYTDRPPVGPYRIEVSAMRCLHLRLNSLDDPEPLPIGVDFATVVLSSVPIVVQHTRLDSRQAENALLSTLAFSQ